MNLPDTSQDRSDIISHWNRVMPQYKPRESQEQTFEWLQNVSPHKKYLLLEMPVGGGKSPVGLTASSFLTGMPSGSSFILTPQKILQRQYEESFNSHILHSMYGKANYRCEKKNGSCEIGSSIKPVCEVCPYRQSLRKAMDSPNLVLNYTLALLYFSYMSEAFPPRGLMVMDECHNLESQLVDFSTFSITEYNCQKISGVKFYKPSDMNDAYRWIGEAYWPRLETYLIEQGNEVQRIESIAHGSIISADDQAIIKNFIQYKRHADAINDILLCNGGNVSQEYVLIDEQKKFTVKELFGKRVFRNIIQPQADRFLFMSSTILNKEGYCRDLGIDPEQAEFLSLDSEFDVSRRRVIFQPTTKMNYGWDSSDPKRVTGRNRMITAIRNILDLHKDVSGIIHTGSFKLSQWIVEELESNPTHLILNHNPVKDENIKRDDVISEYMENATIQPTLLISPSITEGLDLKHDLGRFAIFAKVPFPNLGDAWIKRRMELNKQWYQRQTLTSIIQGSGRICRDHDDWGFTYILDESFSFLYNQTRHSVIPHWWQDGFEIM